MLRNMAHRLQALRFFREVALITGAYLAYEFVRTVSADRVVDALANAHNVVRIEQALGIFAELNLQVAALSFDAFVRTLSLWYFWGHFPLLIVVAVWLFYRHPRHYRWARNAIFLSGGIALVSYVLFPVAPPRLFPGAGFVDTLQSVFAMQYKDTGYVNEFAALPSMHQGFAVIVGAAIYRASGGRKGRLLVFALPLLMLAAIILTGNHWFLDAILGVVVALVGMALATQIETPASGLRRGLGHGLRRLRARWTGLRPRRAPRSLSDA